MANTLKAKYLLIEKTRISKPAQEVLNDIKEATNNFKQVSPALRKEFNNFYDRLKSAKPEAIKGTKEYKEYKEGSGSRNATPEPSKAIKEALAKARENRKSQGLRTDSESIHRDSKRPALKPGKRKSKEGNIYYEYRENRIDRRPSRFPKLGEGGGVGQRSMFDDHMTEEHRGEMAFGGRPKSAIMRDRAYKSEEPHEQAYHRKTSPKNPRYHYEDGGGVSGAEMLSIKGDWVVTAYDTNQNKRADISIRSDFPTAVKRLNRLMANSEFSFLTQHSIESR